MLNQFPNMTNEEFLRKLQNVLIEMSEIWHEPQWEEVSEQLLAENYGYVTLDIAQISFARAESMLNPSEAMETIVQRVERWKNQKV
jgi:hypothetical protein